MNSLDRLTPRCARRSLNWPAFHLACVTSFFWPALLLSAATPSSSPASAPRVLAQIESVPSEFIKNVALIGLAVLGAVYYGKGIFFKEKPSTTIAGQPVQVQQSHPCVDRREFDKHVESDRKEHDNIFSKLGGLERGIRAELKEDFHDVQNSVATMGQQIAALTQAAEERSQQMARMDTKLDRVIERMPKGNL